ncbi:MAG: LysR family transcriptional regulator [Parvibaculaceae bacterium]|nr:LysR family transcriptional regulator [Parvibaculaceae bacterium]
MAIQSAKTHTLNWDDLRIFLAVARDGRLVAAARRLGLDHTTVARRLTAFEEAVQARLVDRSPKGVTLTEAGRELMTYAERVEAEVLAAREALGDRDTRLSGTVRLATPEAFGSYLVAPNVGLLHARHPGIQLELMPESRTVSLSKREADIAVSLNRPPRGRLVAQKLTDYRLGLYASADYLASHAPLKDIATLTAHPLIWYIEELIDMPEMKYLSQIIADAHIVFRSTSIVAQQSAVASGLGLGVLHLFAAGQDGRLVRLLPESVEVTRSYWLTMHADQQHLPRVRAVADFLHEIIRRERERF